MARLLPVLLLAASGGAALFDALGPQQRLAATAHNNGSPPPPPPPPGAWTLNFTSPAPHLFASVPTLLHQWANTMFPNGHALAAVELPAYTLLYHGLHAGDAGDDAAAPEPPSPEWLALDVEMAYGIMGSARRAFLLAFQTTRRVRALYFDGASAALAGLGQLDTQMLLLFGNVTGPGGMHFGLAPEYARAHGLCDWLAAAGLRGPGWGFEGVVRMNAGFEMIWCDFLSPSLRLVSRRNITAPLLPDERGARERGERGRGMPAPQKEAVVADTDELAARGAVTESPAATSYYSLPPQPTKTDRDAEPSHPAAPPNMRGDLAREPFWQMQGWGWFDSATWHYGANRNGPGQGEVRARVLPCGIMSYYSPRLAALSRRRAVDEQTSLNLTSTGLWVGPGEHGNRTMAVKQLARRRRYHHLGNVTTHEALMMRAHSERVLRSLLEPENSCSGAEWTLLTSEIISRVTDQLGSLDTVLASFHAPTKSEKEAYKWLSRLRAQSHLYLVPFMEYPDEISRQTWSTGTAYYQDTHSRCQYRYTRLLVPDALGSELTPEEDDIRQAIEDVYGTICAVLITMHFAIELAWLDMVADKAAASTTLSPKAETWRDNILELTAWLGWEHQYNGCKEQCAWDERCYIPMWPLIHWDRHGRGPGKGPRGRRPGNGTHGGPGRGRGRGPGDGDGHGPDGGEDTPPPPPPDQDRPTHGGPGGPSGPGFQMPPRGRSWMVESPDLWEPKCVNMTFIMGEG